MSKPSACGPASVIVATTSWPITCGNEHSPLIAESVSPSKSRRICLESLPQMPVRSGVVTYQSGRSGVASGISLIAHGVVASACASGLVALDGMSNALRLGAVDEGAH